jgi:hypothetical protein
MPVLQLFNPGLFPHGPREAHEPVMFEATPGYSSWHGFPGASAYLMNCNPASGFSLCQFACNKLVRFGSGYHRDIFWLVIVPW